MGMQASYKMDGITEVFPGFSLAPTGGKVMYVHSSGAGALDYLPPGMSGNPDGFFQSIAAAIPACRASRGDKIIALQGHAENMAVANSLPFTATTSDIEIVGMGTGSNRPSITWTTAASTVTLNQPNIKIRNMRLFLAGAHAAGSALTVAAPITVSADGCEITDCEAFYGFQANRIVGIGITTTAGATRFNFSRNEVYAETIAVPTTTFLRLTGTDFFRMDDTTIIGPGSSATIGPVQQLTTAMLKAKFNRSMIVSTTAASSIAFTAIAGNTGCFNQCGIGVVAGVGVTGGSGFQAANSQVMTAGTQSTLVLT